MLEWFIMICTIPHLNHAWVNNEREQIAEEARMGPAILVLLWLGRQDVYSPNTSRRYGGRGY